MMTFRAALPADAYALAELTIMAGDGMYEFLLGEMTPKEMLAGLMARNMKQDSGGSSWRHYSVAEDQGVVAGMANAFPAEWLRQEESDILPADRVSILDPIDRAQVWDSFLLNGVAVRPEFRLQGIGTRLVAWALGEAKANGASSISANVWRDNLAARALLEKSGFSVQAQVDIPEHPELLHVGGCLVMLRPVQLS
jgi:ribosomal protein S18 acetylase RimI-like enzyme